VVETVVSSSGSSKTISYSVMKREKTGAGIFKVGEKTIPTIQINKSKKFIGYHFGLSFYSLALV
jgi:hypothetical protein